MEEILSREGIEVKVSIGICAYNEEANIGALLDNLLTKQDLPQNSEIIVVCSGCTDSTPEIVRKSCEKDRRVKLIVEPTRNGKAPALNKLLRSYYGDVFIHLDADHIPSNGALQLLLTHFNDPTVGAVSGCQTPLGECGFMDKVNRIIWSLHNETQKYCNHCGIAQHLGGVLFAIRMGICDHLPEDIVNDDAYMGVVCRRRGYQVHFEEEARAFFRAPRTPSEILTQRRRVVYGHLKVRRETGINPTVLEMLPLKRKLAVIHHWMRENWRLVPYFTAVCFIELIVNILARWDMRKKENPHKIWKVATTTKGCLDVVEV